MNGLTGLRVLFFALVVLGLFVSVGNFILGRWYDGAMDLLGAGLWFVFFGIATYIQGRKDENRAYPSWQ